MRSFKSKMLSEDSRSDLGYSRHGNPRHKNYKANKEFPYSSPVEDIFLSEPEEDLKLKIAKKSLAPSKSDSLYSIDKNSFHDTIKISEIATGLSPFPDMYKSRDGAIGSAKSTTSNHPWGFSTLAPPSGHKYSVDPVKEDAEEHIYTLEDLAKKRLREYISLIIADIL